MRYSRFIYTTAMLVVTALPMAANAQTADNEAANAGTVDEKEIIVTARRSAENLQTVPVAVTALEEGALDKGGGFSPLDLQQLAPGIRTAANVGSRTDVVYSIRGQSVTFGNIFPAVIPYFAEVPIVGEFSTGSYFDLENVQILRGPQGVRFGRVTDGGAVLLQPRRPTNDFEGFVNVSVGNYGLVHLTGALNLPIAEDRVLLRVAGERNRRNGFTTNLLTGGDLDNVDYDSIRATLMLSPFDGFENTTTIQHVEGREVNSNALFTLRPENFATNPLAFSVMSAALEAQRQNGPRRVQNGHPGWGPDFGIFGARSQTIISNVTKWDVSDAIQLRNIFGFVHTTKAPGWDYDGSPWARVDSVAIRANRVNMEHYSNEFQINGESFGRALNWTLGVYVDKQKPGGPSETGNGSGTATGALNVSSGVSLQTTTSTAFYGNAELDLSSIVTEGLKINGGLRYTKDDTVALVRSTFQPVAAYLSSAYPAGQCTTAFPCSEFSTESNVWTYEVGASYEFTRGIFGYVSYRKGYRPGGINVFTSSLDPTGEYAPETNQELEVGLKLSGNVGTARYRLNLAAFTDDYRNLQKRINYADPATGVFITSILNAADATIRGVEIESALDTEFGLDLGFNAALTDAKYDTSDADIAQLYNPTNGACNPNVTLNVGFCPFHRFQATPKFQMTASAGYTVPVGEGDVRFGVDVYHQSSMAYADSSELAPEGVGPAYTLVNANLAYRNISGTGIDVTAFVTNLTDKVYMQGVTATSQRASTGSGARMYGPPRMYGLSVRIPFGGK